MLIITREVINEKMLTWVSSILLAQQDVVTFPESLMAVSLLFFPCLEQAF